MLIETWTNNLEDPVAVLFTDILKEGYSVKFKHNDIAISEGMLVKVVFDNYVKIINACNEMGQNNYVIIYRKDEVESQRPLLDMLTKDLRNALRKDYYLVGKTEQKKLFDIEKELSKAQFIELEKVYNENAKTKHMQNMFLIEAKEFDWIDIELFKNQRFSDEQVLCALEVQVRKYLSRKGLKEGQSIESDLEKALFYLIAMVKIVKNERKEIEGRKLREIVKSL